MITTSETPPETSPWYSDNSKVAAFARILYGADWLTRIPDVIDYFEMPYKWNREYGLWVGQSQPEVDSDERWDAFTALLDANDD